MHHVFLSKDPSKNYIVYFLLTDPWQEHQIPGDISFAIGLISLQHNTTHKIFQCYETLISLLIVSFLFLLILILVWLLLKSVLNTIVFFITIIGIIIIIIIIFFIVNVSDTFSLISNDYQ